MSSSLALVVQFLMGGAVVGGVSVLSTLCSDKEAALVYALPITYVPIMVYVWRHARAEKCALILQNFLAQNVGSTAILLLFCVSLYFLMGARVRGKDDDQVPTTAATWGMVGVSLLFVAVPMCVYWAWACDITTPAGGAPCALRCAGDPR